MKLTKIKQYTSNGTILVVYLDELGNQNTIPLKIFNVKVKQSQIKRK